LAARAAHFLATSAVTADALPFMHPTAMQTNPTSALSNFTWANMVYPKAKHRGLTIAGLTVSVACIENKERRLIWVRPGHSPRSDQCPTYPRKRPSSFNPAHTALALGTGPASGHTGEALRR